MKSYKYQANYYRKKPSIISAIQLTEKNIEAVHQFLYGEDSVKLDCLGAFDFWEEQQNVVNRIGLKLKTPESDGETQVASIGDYIVKGYSKEQGFHFWPVKPDYFESAYELVEDQKTDWLALQEISSRTKGKTPNFPNARY